MMGVVLDDKHGIDIINGKSVPYYRVRDVSYYYTSKGNRVVCDTWLQAYNHIARSRGMHTRKDN